jgi:hypothetical protein
LAFYEELLIKAESDWFFAGSVRRMGLRWRSCVFIDNFLDRTGIGKRQESRDKKKQRMHDCMDAWMSRARSAERRAPDEGNWNQEEGKKTTGDRGRQTTVQDQNKKK